MPRGAPPKYPSPPFPLHLFLLLFSSELWAEVRRGVFSPPERPVRRGQHTLLNRITVHPNNARSKDGEGGRQLQGKGAQILVELCISRGQGLRRQVPIFEDGQDFSRDGLFGAPSPGETLPGAFFALQISNHYSIILTNASHAAHTSLRPAFSSSPPLSPSPLLPLLPSPALTLRPPHLPPSARAETTPSAAPQSRRLTSPPPLPSSLPSTQRFPPS